MRGLIIFCFAMLVAAPGASARVKVVSPPGHGVVHFGQRVQAELAGACADAASRIVVRFGATKVAGVPGRGCSPVLKVPSLRRVSRAGYAPGDPVRVELTGAGKRRPLTFWRLQPTELPAVSDPFEPATGAQMETGDSLDLGRVDLDGIQTVSVRNLSSSTGLWEIRAGGVLGPAVARGLLGMPGSLLSAGAEGWHHSVATLDSRPKTPRLFLVIVAGSATVNFVDLNGPGAGLPHRFASDAAFDTLFDGSSFDGWDHIGPGRFELTDGAMRAEHELTDRGWGWQWYSREQFADFVLRLRFKVTDYEDNGGILLRHSDPAGDVNTATDSGDEIQIQEGFENHTGGIAHEADAFRLATNMVGQWNDLEVVAVGPLYVVRINGTEVQRFTTGKQLRGHIAVENEQLIGTKGGHLWYDDVRVHRCVAGDPLCSTG